MELGVGGSSPPYRTKKMNKDKKLKPGLPKGTKDYWGSELALKKKLLLAIENNFKRYGFSPLQTSQMELSSMIGNSLSDDVDNPMSDVFTFDSDGEKVQLIYDLSAGTSRFFSQNYLTLPNPYKRYQIVENVFRREKPGPGSSRLKSFGQCDCDIIGKFSPSIANSELCNLIASTLLRSCGLKKNQFIINISNRKIVQGLMDELKITDEKQRQKVLRAIDKLDKFGFGLKGVEELLKEKRIDSSGAVTIGAKLDNSKASEIINILKTKDLDELKSNLKNPISQEAPSIHQRRHLRLLLTELFLQFNIYRINSFSIFC